MQPELKICPFCGTDSTYLQSQYSYKAKRHFVWAECDYCGARSKAITDNDPPDSSGWSDSACQKAALYWNTRSGDSDA